MIRIYAVYDLKAEQLLGQPLALPNDAAARRMFADLAQGAGAGHLLHDHLEDFCMVNLADFDADSGVITQVASPHYDPFRDPSRVILTGVDLLGEYRRQEAERQAGQLILEPSAT